MASLSHDAAKLFMIYFLVNDLCFKFSVQFCAYPHPFGPQTMLETDSGKELFTMFSFNEAHITFSVGILHNQDPDAKIMKHFALTSRDTESGVGEVEWKLHVIKPLDLDTTKYGVKNIWFSTGLPLVLNFTCLDDGLGRTDYKILLTVNPVDEYTPRINTTTPYVIREDMPLHTFIDNIRILITDKDLVDGHQQYSIGASRYTGNRLADGSLVMEVFQSGGIWLAKSLDYESGIRTYYLNVTARNLKNQSTYGVFTIKILNVNDNPALFVYDNCTSKCKNGHYAISVEKKFTGDLGPLENGPFIKAVDADGDTIKYSIVGGSPSKYATFMRINEKTGVITITQPAKVTRTLLLTAIVQAKSFSDFPDSTAANTPPVSAYAVVLVWLDYQNPNTMYHTMYSSGGTEGSLPMLQCAFGSIFMITMVVILR